MGILADQLVMSERVLRQEQVDSVTLDYDRFNRSEEASSARQANSQKSDRAGSLGLNGYYAEGNKHPDNRQTIDGGGTVGKDGSGYETINDSKFAGFISNPASVGAITQTSAGYEDIIDHHQMYTDGEWENEGIYGV